MNEQVIAIIEKIKPDIRKFLDKDFIAEDILDSLDVMNLIGELEDDFGIEFEPEDILPNNFASVDTIVALVIRTKG
jgi:acyl carrier protein